MTLDHIKSIYEIADRGGFLKILFCLAGEAKPAMVATNLAPNFNLEDFFSS